MLTIFSDDHRLQAAKAELDAGTMKPAVERPERADMILRHVREAKLGPVEGPESFGTGPLERVHTIAYLSFLRTAFDEWRERYGTSDALAINWAVRGLRQIIPEAIDGKLGYFGGDAGTPITAGTWQAATSSAAVALTGAWRLKDGDPVFALCRPPGHHASRDVFQGYCFLNNAAIAAQWLRDAGAGRVAVLDVDYHHGNGTQEIFFDRDDVLFVSIHADPRTEFPYFLGHVDETGRRPRRRLQPQPAAPLGDPVGGLRRGAGKGDRPRWRTTRRTRWSCRSAPTSTAMIRFPASSSRLRTSPGSARRSAG